MENIGTIDRIMVYPVKGMQGVETDYCPVTRKGLLFDREHGLRIEGENSRNISRNYVTGRKFPEIVLYKLWIAKDHLFVGSPTQDGYSYQEFGDQFAQEISDRLHKGVKAEYNPGIHDSQPVSLIGMETIRSLEKEVGTELNPLRFRENLYINFNEGISENDLVGEMIQIGDTLLYVDEKTVRCQMVNIDPETAEINKAILKTVIDSFDRTIGVYASVVQSGSIKAGDLVSRIK